MAEHETSTPPASEAGRPPKVIKRYTNRKLYDTVESRYVTLDEIAEMVKAGAEVRIVDNRTKEDLTSVTLAQIIFEEEKKTSKMPLGMLRDIIRGSGERLQTFISDELNPRVAHIRETTTSGITKIFKRGPAEEARDVHTTPEAAALAQPSPREQAQAFVRSSRSSIEEWQARLDDRVRGAYETVAGLPTLHREIQALRDKLAELEKKLEEQK